MGIAGLMVGTLFAAAPAAMAKGGGGGVTRQGSCSAAADWKLSVKPEDGRLQVEFEVEHAKPGSTWSVRMADNGTNFFTGSRTASNLRKFEVRKLTNNRAGADKVTARATNMASGQVCNATATR
jgi:hypothetical protein